jgi:hypothetical protein
MNTESKLLLEQIKSNKNPLKLLIDTLNLLKNENGFEQDILTPGFIKEWMISEILGHKCHKTKHGADATSLDGKEQYEYLSCKQGGSFQLDRIDDTNLHRIKRNDAFFFAQFDKSSGLNCTAIWRGETKEVLKLAKVKISKMKSSSKHIGFSKNDLKKMKCELIYGK